jgi:hypothetical protein
MQISDPTSGTAGESRADYAERAWVRPVASDGVDLLGSRRERLSGTLSGSLVPSLLVDAPIGAA